MPSRSTTWFFYTGATESRGTRAIPTRGQRKGCALFMSIDRSNQLASECLAFPRGLEVALVKVAVELLRGVQTDAGHS